VGTPALLEGEVSPSQNTTPYQRWGDLVAWCALALVGAAPIWVKIRRYRIGGISMTSARRLLALVLLAAVPGFARAAVDCTVREPDLPHVCDKGPNAGKKCEPDFTGADTFVCSLSRPAQPNPASPGAVDCLGAKCTMVLQPGGNFSAVMTIIADNNVSGFDNTQPIQNAIAVTVVIDLGKRGVLSQTYQNLSSLTSAPVDTHGIPIDEQRLKDETDLRDGKAAIVNDLLFRPQDSEIADALRAIFNTTGTPVVTKVGSVSLIDRRADGLATVLRLKVKGGFVAD